MARAQLSPTPALGPPPTRPDHSRSTRLADLLVEVARCVDQDVAAVLPSPFEKDLRLDALRSVLLEQEQTALARLQQKFDDPRQFAQAVSSVLAEALALAESRDEQLAKVLAPALGRAAQASMAPPSAAARAPWHAAASSAA